MRTQPTPRCPKGPGGGLERERVLCEGGVRGECLCVCEGVCARE